jgi:iron(III) transport system substrate-binding protein
MNRVRPGRRPLIAVLVVAAVAAAAALAVASGGTGDALVVYNGRSHYGGEEAFERFERETGIEVQLFGGDATELYERLQQEGEDTPADVLVTVDGANLWLAEDAGLLAPSNAAAVRRNVPADLRDPDGEWTAVSTRVRTVVRSTDRVPEDAVASYADLGAERWRGRVCQRTSNNIYNQSMVASFVAERGQRATERLLRSWMDNDPQVLGSDVDVLKAIAADRCDLGLTNHYYLAREVQADADFPVAPVWVEQDGAGVHTNISGAGVVAASDRKADAERLVAYLTEPASQRDIGAMGEFPANPGVQTAVGELGPVWREDFERDPIDVAAAGRNQKAAVQLMARVGWE